MPAPDYQPPPPQASPAPPSDYSKPPDYSHGRLSDTQLDILQKWLVLKWGKGNPKGLPHCEMCKEPNMQWIAGQHIGTPIQFINGAIQLMGGVVYPVIAISCSNCGNTHFINAIQAGVLTHIGGGKLRETESKKEASNG